MAAQQEEINVTTGQIDRKHKGLMSSIIPLIALSRETPHPFLMETEAQPEGS